MRKRVFSRIMLLALLSALLAAPGVFDDRALATEGGGGAYPNGAEGFMAGALPPPGTYALNYMQYYRASKFADNNGNALIPNFSLTAFADVLRLVHVTKTSIFGANYGAQILIPVVYQSVDLGPGSNSRWGLGDIIIDPFILGWHTKNLHVTTGIDIYVPVGTYDQDNLANAGRNYWTFEPVLGITYLSDNGFEVSSKFMYDFNTENNDTHYTSGQEFHFDYTVGYHIDKAWAVGLGGYYYYQTTDDEQNGVTVGDGFQGRAFALGPQVQYNYKNLSFTLKYQHEFEVRNKPEGDKVWFNLVYAF